MVRVVSIELDDAVRVTLIEMRDHHPKAQMRERAAAVLKVADGMQLKEVGAYGLLKRRHPDVVGNWIKRFKREGLAGLYDRPGRGRKPSFFPPQ